MARLKNVSFFKKMLFSYVIVVFIPVLLITFVYLYYYHLELIGRIENNAIKEVSHLSLQVDTIGKNINNFALQLSFSTELNKTLKAPTLTNVYEYSMLKEFFNSQVAANDMLYSIYIYFYMNDKVLTTNEGFYNREEFFDKGIIGKFKAESTAESKSYGIRTIKDPLEIYKPVEVISFHQALPFGARLPLGSMIINVKKKEFFEALDYLSQMDHVYIFATETGEQLYPSTKINEDPVGNLFKKMEDTAHPASQVETVNGRKYFVVSYPSLSHSWTFIKLVPYDQYFQPMLSRMKKIGTASSIVLLLGLLLSYLFALMIYSPWKKMVRNVASHLKYQMKPRNMNEYAFVNDSIQYLIRENEKISTAMRENQPMIKYRLIYDILNNHIIEPGLVLKQLTQIGIQFTHSHYAALIVSSDLRAYEDHPDYNQIKIMIFSLIERSFAENISIGGTILDNMRFGYIINLDNESLDTSTQSQFREVCNQIKCLVQTDFNIDLLFCFGRAYPSLDRVNHSYEEAKNVLNNKALIQKSNVIFMQDNQFQMQLEYPLLVQKELVLYIRKNEKNKIEELINLIFNKYIHSMKYSHEKLQEMLITLMAGIKTEIIMDGFDPKVHMNMLKINLCHNSNELRQFITDYLHELTDGIHCKQRNSDNVYIEKAIEYIENHYQEIQSIGDISNIIGLSSSYLSRIFKATTGTPPLEYLNKYRIRKSKDLLETDDCNINEISQVIGYKDVHSFIRFFKKYEGMTPKEYKKNALKKERSDSISVDTKSHVRK